MGGWLFCTNKAFNAFICHYNEPVGPDLPVVAELNQILSPCVLGQALKKQMTHGSRPRYQYTVSLVIFMDADNTHAYEMPEVASACCWFSTQTMVQHR